MVQVKHLSSDEEHMESIYREFLSIYSKGNVFKDDVLKQMKINRYSPENDRPPRHRSTPSPLGALWG